MSRVAMVAVTAVLGLAGPALASGGSAQDQIACTPDVYRLCSANIPDEDAIVACLKQHLPNLSAACHQVMTRPDTGKAGGNNSDDDD